MKACDECAKLWNKPLPPQSGCNDCYDLLRDYTEELEANLKIAREALEKIDRNYLPTDRASILANEALEKLNKP